MVYLIHCPFLLLVPRARGYAMVYLVRYPHSVFGSADTRLYGNAISHASAIFSIGSAGTRLQ